MCFSHDRPLEHVEETALCPFCGNSLDADAARAANVTLAGPWRRCTARTIDIFLGMLVIAIFIGMIWNVKSMGNYVLELVAFPLYFLFDSAVYLVFGNTLGKWLFGIKLVDPDGKAVSKEKHFQRNLRVYWGGFGLGIPIIALVTQVFQYWLVSKGQPASYDKIMNLKSILHNASAIKTFCGIVLCIILSFVFVSFFGNF